MGQNWVEKEISGCDFVDVRLNRRLGAMLEALGERPGKSLPTAFQDWANTKAAYRFFDNDAVSEDKILAGHFRSTAPLAYKRPTDQSLFFRTQRILHSSAQTLRRSVFPARPQALATEVSGARSIWFAGCSCM